MKTDTDRIVGLTAMFVAVASLVALMYQTYLMRQAQHASVLPYLTFVVLSNQETTSFALRNTGIGPARIDDVRIRYKGREIESEPYEFFLSTVAEASQIPLGSDKVQAGRLVPAGEWINMVSSGQAKMLGVELLKLFEVAEVPRAWYTAANAEGGEKAVVEIAYSSVYGDRWRVRSDRLIPDEL